VEKYHFLGQAENTLDAEKVHRILSTFSRSEKLKVLL
jgi:hypothetical protein